MKKLQLKIQDLVNPTILTHSEIKNILGGSGIDENGWHNFSCLWTFADGGGTYILCSNNSNSLLLCQNQYDALCDPDDTCQNVDCQY